MIKNQRIMSDRALFQAEKELCLLQIINDFFVQINDQTVTVDDFINYLIIHKTPYLKIAQNIVKDAQLLGYITVENSNVKATPLLHETVVTYEKNIQNYHNKNDFTTSNFDVDRSFRVIISLLKQLLKRKYGDS
jgi:hypothetical protein